MARKEIKIFMDSKEVSNFLKVIDWSWLFTFLSERYNVSLSPRKELKELHDKAAHNIIWWAAFFRNLRYNNNPVKNYSAKNYYTGYNDLFYKGNALHKHINNY